MLKRRRALLVSILGFAVLSACGGVGVETVSVDLGRVDFFADDLLFDVCRDTGAEGRSFEGCRFTRGWARTGAGGRWAIGPSAEVEVVAGRKARRLWVECRPSNELAGPQIVTVVVDGEVAGEFRPDLGGYKWYQLELPENTASRVRHLEFRFSQVRMIDQAAGRKDSRPLALMVRRLAMTQGPKKPFKRDWSPAVVRTPNGVRVREAGQLILNVRTEAHVEQFEIGLRAGGEARAPARLSLFHPKSETCPSQGRFDLRSSRNGTVSLAAGGLGGDFQIIIDVGHGGLEIDRLEAKVQHHHPSKEGDQRNDGEQKTARPDIVVIVLDATRADHSGSSYDYFRDTMPNIDLFAGDALVFDQVLAQAPYTTCSVPTMFTGLSWRTHGVIRGRDRLPDGEETIAESLRASGYQTLGISATPNHSERLGMAQGYDEFVQLWEGADWRTSIDPMFAVKRLQTRLQQGLDEKPLFLMLHLVPPHSPYTPPADFRHWSDPEYDGPCNGTDQYLRSIRRNRESVSPADLEELVALYDGNLRYSDAAVKEVLKALAGVDRLDQAVVVITSDHGEAFFEHGRLDHNTTIYDEMLRVPLIVRFPASMEVPVIDPSELISLEDLVPTLLGLAGLKPSPRSTGIDFLAGSGRDEILHRSTEGQSLFGFRTNRWKLIADRQDRLFELYDLTADPDERENVVLHRREVVSWLADRWERAEAELPPKMDVMEVSTSEDEKAMLRELGYLD